MQPDEVVGGRTATKSWWDTENTDVDPPCEPWESEMSDTVAHLVSAYAAVERLRKLTPTGQLAAVSCELASQSICTALVTLDECAINILAGPGASKRARAARWRESLLAVYSDLGLMK